MRIVIEVDGERVTAIGPDAPPVAGGPAPMVGDVPPGPAPAELLKRARELGAKSAGAARFGGGAALASVVSTEQEPKRPRGGKKAAKKRGRRAR